MQNVIRFSLALRMFLAAVVLLPASLGALSQEAPAVAPSGSSARSLLDLQAQHMTLSVANLAVERDWYIEKLGFTLSQPAQMGSGSGTPPPPNPKMQAAQLHISGYRIDLIQYAGSERPKTPSPRYLAQGWVHIAFTASDLEKAFSFLQAAGTDVKANRDDKNALMGLLLHDPEGNEIEIFSR